VNVERSAVIPIVIAASLLAVLLAVLTYFVAICDYHHYQHRGELPAFSVVFERLLPAAWLLPLLTIGIGLFLLRRSERSLAAVVWYLAGVVMVGAVWSAATFVALHLMYVCFHHNL
jgi:hypothetical protein